MNLIHIPPPGPSLVLYQLTRTNESIYIPLKEVGAISPVLRDFFLAAAKKLYINSLNDFFVWNHDEERGAQYTDWVSAYKLFPEIFK